MTKISGNDAPSRRRIIKGAGVLAAGIAAPALIGLRSAYAAYPERTVKIVVANTPGGPSDLVGRVVAAALQQSTGKTFIIENRGLEKFQRDTRHRKLQLPLPTQSMLIYAQLAQPVGTAALHEIQVVCVVNHPAGIRILPVDTETAGKVRQILHWNNGMFGSRSPPGGVSPKCRYACRVAMRPRAVRIR